MEFTLNDKSIGFDGDKQLSLLSYLREQQQLTSVKDGCSGQGACGACLVEIDGKAVLACRTPMEKVAGSNIVTIEGFPTRLKETLGKAFVEKGAVQCGFCTPGFLSRTRILLQKNPDPTREEIKKALALHMCRCTGYVKIIDAILLAAHSLRENKEIVLQGSGKIGQSLPKYDAYQKAIGQSDFIADMHRENMAYGALTFSKFPRARVIRINTTAAEALPGVLRVFTSRDIPGERITGHLKDDWPLMINEGETTRYIGDVLAGVVAKTEAIARAAADLVAVEYEELEPLTDMMAAEHSPIHVHEQGNLLSVTCFQNGKQIDAILSGSAHVVSATYKTQRVEHGFLETEAAIAEPWGNDGLRIFVQSQGISEDCRCITRILNLPGEKVDVTLIPCGGAFGGKEDMTVQGHAALFAYLLKQPVRVRLNREESLRMHPKRHPMIMNYQLGCDNEGRLTALKADIVGDTGAYASLGAAVLSRSAGHAAGGYHVPNVDVTAKAVYTNNIPCGAMRGFGVNQVTFAMESAVDELCEIGGFDRWQFRYDNALGDGSRTITGQTLVGGVGLKETLLAVKDEFQQARYAGLAIGIKNIGFGNGLVDESDVKIEIISATHINLHHGWTEMGQGIDTVAIQIFCEETGLDTPGIVEIKRSTAAGIVGGTTTASRGTFLLGNAIIDAAQKIKNDLQHSTLAELAGSTYWGHWRCDWTTEPLSGEESIIHVAYGYASQVVILNDEGSVQKVVAAHDVGRVINPLLVEGQVEGGIVMGLGYAFSEDLSLKNGQLKTIRYGKLGIPRIKQVPEIVVKLLEVSDPYGPYGAKGVGEIGLVPTAAAAANARYQFDKTRQYQLPIKTGKA
ncbi:MAG: selenium-dependent xanthine dehydrogenase [Deltaproteobacteria bacterium]|nr:selenium-dependent xanthine dehydrogenase [Deltaproteobacteria bacterium]